MLRLKISDYVHLRLWPAIRHSNLENGKVRHRSKGTQQAEAQQQLQKRLPLQRSPASSQRPGLAGNPLGTGLSGLDGRACFIITGAHSTATALSGWSRAPRPWQQARQRVRAGTTLGPCPALSPWRHTMYNSKFLSCFVALLLSRMFLTFPVSL